MKIQNIVLVSLLTLISIELLGDGLPIEKSVSDLFDQGKVEVKDGVLDLSRKKLTSLKGLKNIEEPEKVRVLRLYGNYLEKLPAGIFDDFVNLEKCYLTFNNLKELPLGTFKQLRKLEILKLDHNKLGALPAGIFDDLVNLRQLHLDFNELEAVPDNLLLRLTKLEWLFLDNNKLKTPLPPTLFNGPVHFERVAISGNLLDEKEMVAVSKELRRAHPKVIVTLNQEIEGMKPLSRPEKNQHLAQKSAHKKNHAVKVAKQITQEKVAVA
jgi:hypothetical protein